MTGTDELVAPTELSDRARAELEAALAPATTPAFRLRVSGLELTHCPARRSPAGSLWQP
jgi:hypothetical protein